VASDTSAKHGLRTALSDSALYLICDTQSGGSTTSLVRRALKGGADIVQLRDKNADDSILTSVGTRLCELCHSQGALLIVNDRPDIALACGADGVHIGQNDLPPAAVRSQIGTDLLLGISTHSAWQIDQACLAPSDYIAVGPVFETPTKPGAQPVGYELIRYARAYSDKPFFAIGGIDITNVEDVLLAGASRIACVRAICEARDPRAAASALCEKLRSDRGELT
jgi:thiamine-phosphate pyrophosphorylase